MKYEYQRDIIDDGVNPNVLQYHMKDECIKLLPSKIRTTK